MAVDDTVLPSQVLEGLQNLIAKQNGPDNAASLLYQENFRLREARRALELERADLKAQLQTAQAGLPKADQKIVPSSEVEELAAYRVLGSVKEVSSKLDSAVQLARTESIRTIAGELGWVPEVLTTLLSDTVKVERLDVREGEKTVSVPAVRSDNGTLIPLRDHAKSAWAPFLIALEVKGVRGNRNTGDMGGAENDEIEVFVQSPPGQGSGKTTQYSDLLAERVAQVSNRGTPKI